MSARDQEHMVAVSSERTTSKECACPGRYAARRITALPFRMLGGVAIVGLFLGSVAPVALSQRSTAPSPEKSLYVTALFASLEEMQRSWGEHTASGFSDRVPLDFHNMIVEENDELLGGSPTSRGEYRVEFLDHNELVERCKRLRKEFAALVVHPITGDGDRLSISVVINWMSYEKRMLNYAVSDWAEVLLRYDCETSRFVVDEVKLGGI